jgi:hypothetical protein
MKFTGTFGSLHLETHTNALTSWESAARQMRALDIRQAAALGAHLPSSEIDLGLVAASYGRPQLALQWLRGLLQLGQQGRRDGDVVAPVQEQ